MLQGFCLCGWLARWATQRPRSHNDSHEHRFLSQGHKTEMKCTAFGSVVHMLFSVSVWAFLLVCLPLHIFLSHQENSARVIDNWNGFGQPACIEMMMLCLFICQESKEQSWSFVLTKHFHYKNSRERVGNRTSCHPAAPDPKADLCS